MRWLYVNLCAGCFCIHPDLIARAHTRASTSNIAGQLFSLAIGFACTMSGPQVDLGFLDKCEPWLLTNKYFPSKVGGLPAWLELDSIPSNDCLRCSVCSETMLFLCQVSGWSGAFSMRRSTENNSTVLFLTAGICAAGRIGAMFSSDALRVHMPKRGLLEAEYIRV